MNALARTVQHGPVWLLVVSLLGFAATESKPDPAGHWEGALDLPATELGVRVDLEKANGQSWQGTIDIPVQGLRGFKLDPVEVDGAKVHFAMPNIPGDPQFAGRVSEDDKTLTGDFTQAGQKFPFKLERKPRPVTATGETPSRGVPGEGLVGHWQGSLKPMPVIELRLVLELTNSPSGKPGGAMVSVDQGHARIPITALTENAGTVHLETKSVGGVFDGKLSGDGSEIAGDWKQGGQTLPLVFRRLAQAPHLNRPQEPKKPYPYDEEEVTVENRAAGLKLAGTLTLPRGSGPHPAVVFITGSGPQDRDEAIMGHRPFFVLADHLTRQGIAVLRCDDRGVGKSTGNFGKATDTDFVEDTLAAMAYLRGCPEIDSQHIGLLGHSEGGIIAPRAAVKSPDTSFIVLLAGVGVPMEELLVRQGRDIARVMGAGEEVAATNAALQRAIFRVVKEEQDPAEAEAALRNLFREQLATLTDEQRRALGLSEAMLEGQVKMVLSPWFRELLTCDPRPTLRAVKCPVLALNGEKDLQVAAKENLAAIREALTAGGNQRAKTAELPGLNHLFQTCRTGAMAEYGRIEETFNPAAMTLISDWIREITGSRGASSPPNQGDSSPTQRVATAGLDNPDFERGEPGAVPPGWFVPKLLADQGFSATVTTNQPNQGRRCAEIRWPKDRQPSADFANLMQRIDATPWRNQRIKITSAIRVEARTPDARAQMWVRVDRPGGMGAFDNMDDRPVRSDSWVNYSTTLEVADDARTLNVGLMTFDGATAWWDDVRIEVLGEFTTLTEPPCPLSDAGLSNLVAFTRLLGYVRHFHPSDQASTNDWLAFVVTVLPQIESAENSAALAARLEAAFRPVAPTVRVFETGHEPPLPAELTISTDAAQLRVLVWEHVGYGQGSATGVQDAYSSQRLSLKASELAPLPSYAQPTNVFRGSLGAGIACLVPTALFADEQGTLPGTEPSAVPAGSETRFSVAHRGARLATVMLTWNVLQHFYPYFDVIDTDWSKELAGALRAAATDADEAGFYRTLNRLIVALQDGHGSLSGLGSPQVAPAPIKVQRIEGKIVVAAVAAEIRELRPGDVVERIDGVGATEAFEALASQISAATPEWRNRAAFRLGWGPVDRPVTLEVRSEHGPVRTVTLARSGTPDDRKRPPKLHEIRPGLFYVDVTRISQEEFDEALPRLTQARALVFDVRGYPTISPKWLTHLSPKPLQSALWNIPRQHWPDHTDVEWMTDRWNLQPGEPQLTTHRVFLTDGSAISYAESLMGIVEAYHLGEIVGEPTAGTNGNICLVDLPLGYRMVFTGMNVLKHDGSRHHGVGIQPTVRVAQTLQGIRDGRDEQLERALELLRVE